MCEPALGSGAFAIEAVRQLAEEYLQRRQAELGERIDPEEYPQELQKVKAYIALHNVYGVDLNPTAVELAEVSLWLDSMSSGLKAPWFGLRLRAGNSLIGARRATYAASNVLKAGEKAKKTAHNEGGQSAPSRSSCKAHPTPSFWVRSRRVRARRLLRLGERPNFSLSDSTAVRPSHYGINIRGRSRRLRLNYRTTAQNLKLALSILDGGDYSGALDSDDAGSDELTTRHGTYRSLMRGPAPEFFGAETLSEEFDHVARVLRAWLEDMGEEEHASPRIGILTRTKTQRDNLVRALEERGLRVQNIDRGGYLNGAPAVMTLHRSKGTEFERVILFGIDDQHVPYAVRGYHFDTDGHNEAMLRERSLLYVGATRARERLLVTWTRQRSAYLPR
ncbi:3'-5' exonuclease [Dermabacter vaginalis]|uniref:3'-5' exonuclease n=1 Tax=Dermabacter vaginalis TaxID=1630135 RepID=UPI001EF59A96|nr:hypothetical protein [Dermabacter vaginalis]